jgi:hypothetical protein
MAKEKFTYQELKNHITHLETQVKNLRNDLKREMAIDELLYRVLDPYHDPEMTNAALTVLLKKREENKTELEGKVLANMKQLVEPYLEKLNGTGPNKAQQTCLSILTQNLKEIIAPFALSLSSKYLDFFPTEIRIVNLVSVV